MPVAYTDLFNEALDDLTTSLSAISGLQVVNDPRNIVPPCVLIDACSFEAFNYKIVSITFPVQIITLGPNNLDAQRSLLNIVSKVLGANIAVTDGRPTVSMVGDIKYPSYSLNIQMRAST